MKSKKIVDGETLVAELVRDSDWENGLHFISSPDDYIQVGTWEYPKGKNLQVHKHLSYPRTGLKTQEFIFIKEGSVRVEIFSEDKRLLGTEILKKGDFIILLHGAHGYEILEDNTRVIEVKNGPYSGPDKDRVRI